MSKNNEITLLESLPLLPILSEPEEKPTASALIIQRRLDEAQPPRSKKADLIHLQLDRLKQEDMIQTEKTRLRLTKMLVAVTQRYNIEATRRMVSELITANKFKLLSEETLDYLNQDEYRFLANDLNDIFGLHSLRRAILQDESPTFPADRRDYFLNETNVDTYRIGGLYRLLLRIPLTYRNEFLSEETLFILSRCPKENKDDLNKVKRKICIINVDWTTLRFGDALQEKEYYEKALYALNKFKQKMKYIIAPNHIPAPLSIPLTTDTSVLTSAPTPPTSTALPVTGPTPFMTLWSNSILSGLSGTPQPSALISQPANAPQNK